MIHQLREWLGTTDPLVVGVTRRAELKFHTHGFQVRLYVDFREVGWSNGPLEEALPVAILNSRSGIAELAKRRINEKGCELARLQMEIKKVTEDMERLRELAKL